MEAPVEFDSSPYLLGVRNGVVDVRTGEFRDYQPEDLISFQLDVTYDPKARCPRFIQFLEEIQPNVTDRLTLVDWFPATAIRRPLPYVLFLLGLGRNGKGIYERLIKRFFGKAAFRTMALAEATKNNFAAAYFYKKLGWLATEQSGKKKSKIGTDFVKLVSGADGIDTDRKHQSRLQFDPYFQTIVDTNAMPVIEDTSIGWMERFCKQDLPFVFVDNPDPDNPLEKKKDPHLFDKLTTDEELSGLLNLLIWRAKEISKTEVITKRAADELFNEYTKQSASLSTFWDEFCEYNEFAESVRLPTNTIYDAYKRWCGHLVGEIVDEARFGRYLKKQCGGRDPVRPTVDGTKVRAYPGLLFDEDHLNAVIESLDIERTGKNQYGPVKDQKNPLEKGRLLSNGPVRPVNLWNEAVQRFGGLPKDKSSYRDEPSNLPVLPVLPVHSIASDPISDNLTGPVPVQDQSFTGHKTYLVLEGLGPIACLDGKARTLRKGNVLSDLPAIQAEALIKRGVLKEVRE